MKSVILFVIMMCCSFVAKSQDTLSYKHTFRVLISGASPTGDFNNTEFEDDYPDFAQEGTLITTSYIRMMNQFISVGPSIHYRSHKYDLDQFARGDDELVLHRDSESWRSLFMMADLYLYSPNNGTGYFYLKGSAGASFNRSAEVNISTTYGAIELPADKASAFAWGIGAGVQGYYKAWGIIIEFSQLSTTPTFMGKDTKGNAMEYKQPMNTLNLGIGASYSF